MARPAVERPGKIVCVGLNYRSHVTEGAGRDIPDRPLLFSKFANAVIGDGEAIVRPEGCHALDLEVELGVVIGKVARRVPQDQAMGHVAGYVVVNDVSARDWQGSPPALRDGEKGDGQWLRAKGSDTFLPMGPVLVTRDALDPAAGLRLRSWRLPAGTTEPQLMQDGTTSDLIFGIPELIAFISRHITLEPGRRHRDRHAGRRRRVPRPADLPRAGRPRPVRDRGHRLGREPDRRLDRRPARQVISAALTQSAIVAAGRGWQGGRRAPQASAPAGA